MCIPHRRRAKRLFDELQETPRAVEEDQLEVAETVVLLTEMLRAIGAELRQQKEKTARLARLEAMQAGY